MDTNFLKLGNNFLAEAQKKMRGGFFSNMFGSKEYRSDEACELYKQAANQFKLGKLWQQAADAYLKCAECSKISKSDEEVDYYMEAANMLSKVNTAEAIKLYEEASDLYCYSGQISQAAKIKKSIAEIYEQELEYSLAAKFYKDSADLYYAEQDQTSAMNQMLLKAAELMSLDQTNGVFESIKIYEQVAKKYQENRLTAPSARQLFFKASLLYLVNDDTVGCQNALERYNGLDPTLNSTREYKFSQQILNAIESKDMVKFSDECHEFNKVIPLTKWLITILKRIQDLLEKNMKSYDGGFL